MSRCLHRAGIFTIRDLTDGPIDRLSGIAGLGEASVEAIRRQLRLRGVHYIEQSSDRRRHGAWGFEGRYFKRSPIARRSRRLLTIAGALLPPLERERWVEEWAGELHALPTRRARARLIMSLLTAAGPKLAVTLRRERAGRRPAWPAS